MNNNNKNNNKDKDKDKVNHNDNDNHNNNDDDDNPQNSAYSCIFLSIPAAVPVFATLVSQGWLKHANL